MTVTISISTPRFEALACAFTISLRLRLAAQSR